jgi:hypothetical protein
MGFIFYLFGARELLTLLKDTLREKLQRMRRGISALRLSSNFPVSL